MGKDIPHEMNFTALPAATKNDSVTATSPGCASDTAGKRFLDLGFWVLNQECMTPQTLRTPAAIFRLPSRVMPQAMSTAIL